MNLSFPFLSLVLHLRGEFHSKLFLLFLSLEEWLGLEFLYFLFLPLYRWGYGTVDRFGDSVGFLLVDVIWGIDGKLGLRSYRFYQTLYVPVPIGLL
jgi:hypothetical protein